MVEKRWNMAGIASVVLLAMLFGGAALPERQDLENGRQHCLFFESATGLHGSNCAVEVRVGTAMDGRVTFVSAWLSGGAFTVEGLGPESPWQDALEGAMRPGVRFQSWPLDTHDVREGLKAGSLRVAGLVAVGRYTAPVELSVRWDASPGGSLSGRSAGSLAPLLAAARPRGLGTLLPDSPELRLDVWLQLRPERIAGLDQLLAKGIVVEQ